MDSYGFYSGHGADLGRGMQLTQEQARAHAQQLADTHRGTIDCIVEGAERNEDGAAEVFFTAEPKAAAKPRWNSRTCTRETIPEIDAFLADIRAVCVKHKLSIGHEDGHGSFQIELYDEVLMTWLEDASDDRTL